MSDIVGNFVEGFLSGRAQGSWKRRAAHAILPLLFAAALAGCAIHPVQQDVTGVPPKLILDRIRCEARLAVFDKAIDVLHQTADKLRNPKANSNLNPNPVLADKFDAIARELESQRGGSLKLDPRWLPTVRAKEFYGRYITTVIAYDFLMQGVENNKVALTVDPVRLITNGTAGITLGGSGELMRDNQRHFAIADTFGDLLFDKKMECESQDYLAENFVYPVSGRVGLREVIDTFIELNEDKPLSEFDSTAKTVFADTLKFTTTWTGAATPHVQIDPVGSQFGLASGTNIGLTASRSDVHTLTVGLAMGPPQTVPLGVPFIVQLPRSSLYGIQQSNKAAAFQAIQDLRVRSFLDRAILR